MRTNRRHESKNRDQQLDLALKTENEGWYTLKNNLSSYRSIIGLLPFWRHFSMVFSLVTIVIVSIVAFSCLLLFNSKMSNQTIFFFQHSLGVWNIVPKLMLYFGVVIFTIVQGLTYYMSYRIYFMDRRLALAINFLIIYSAVLFFVGFSQILSLMVL